MSMNIYQKLAEARVRFQSAGIKQSGQNKFAGYSYYELSDILPTINKLSKELGFVCVVSFDNENLAVLALIDAENPEQVINFYSPMSTASLKGCHEVQNLGAVQTYIKRYLYQNAFEIVEHDALNSTHNPDEKPTKEERQAVLSNQARDIADRIRKADADQLADIGNELKGLQLSDYDKKVLRQEYAMRTKALAPPAE